MSRWTNARAASKSSLLMASSQRCAISTFLFDIACAVSRAKRPSRRWELGSVHARSHRSERLRLRPQPGLLRAGPGTTGLLAADAAGAPYRRLRPRREAVVLDHRSAR